MGSRGGKARHLPPLAFWEKIKIGQKIKYAKYCHQELQMFILFMRMFRIL
jgi:hypothetical protein